MNIADVEIITAEEILGRGAEIIKTDHWINEDGGVEIYTTSYDERQLSEKTLAEIAEADNPREYFEDMLSEWSSDFAYDYGGYDELYRDIYEKLTPGEQEAADFYRDKIYDYLYENIYFYYDEKDFDNEVCVNIRIDSGNANVDYTCDNALNWYGQYDGGKLDANSSILWLAKTQGKATKLRKAVKAEFNGKDVEELKDKFITSCVQELENLTTSMGTVTFLVQMSLSELLDLLELQKKGEKESYMTIGKDVECGLYDPWNGGGSVLEIRLDRDVKVPLNMCTIELDCSRRWSIENVYGVAKDLWRPVLKQVVVA